MRRRPMGRTPIASNCPLPLQWSISGERLSQVQRTIRFGHVPELAHWSECDRLELLGVSRVGKPTSIAVRLVVAALAPALLQACIAKAAPVPLPVAQGKQAMPSDLRELTNKEIEALLVGRILRIDKERTNLFVHSYEEHFRPNAVLVVHIDHGRRQGTYNIEKNSVCTRMKDDPTPSCRKLYRDDAGNLFEKRVGDRSAPLESIAIN